MARDAEVAIVLRRGPTRRVRLLRWDLRDDTVQGGQWLEGTVAPGACAVSPSGELFVYFARKGGRTFTCVSRPPYFTALAFWASELPWTGGGFFAEDDHIVLGLTHAPDEGALPPGLKVTDIWSYLPWRGNVHARSTDTFGDAVLRAPEAHQGWQKRGFGWEKPCPGDPLLVLERAEAPGLAGACRLRRTTAGAATEVEDLGSLEWVDWTKDGTLLFGDAGRLFRRRARGRRAGEGAARLIADLTTQQFEPMEAPESARRWPGALGASSNEGRSGPRRRPVPG